MQIVLTVLEITAPVFLLAAVGFVWVRAGFDYPVAFVTRLGMTLAIPCLIFVALMTTDVDPSALSAVMLASIVGYLVLTLVAWALVKVLRLEVPTYLGPMIFGNTGNLGLPLALFAFGDVGLGYAVVVFAVSAIFVFTLGVWLVAGEGAWGKVMREPMVPATLLGALFVWQGWETPTFLTNALTLIGDMGIPLMLITLGVAVAQLTPGNLGRAVWFSALKTGVCIVIAWGVGWAFGLPPVPLAVLVVQLSTPVAVTSYLLAEKYGADARSVAGLVVVSTVISVGTIPLTLAFFV